MPRPKKLHNENRPPTDSERVHEAIEEGTVTLTPNDTIVTCDQTAESAQVACVVTMKLQTFCTDARLLTKIKSTVLSMNRLVAEAYAFANFHITRVLTTSPTGAGLPRIDRSYYYRCILAVSINNCRRDTMSTELQDSMTQFDAMRPIGYTKVDVLQHNQIVASLSVLMATMGTNHLWMNLERRLTRYINNFHVRLKHLCKRVVSAVCSTPTISLDKLFPKLDSLRASSLQRIDEAKQLCLSLRLLMPLGNGKMFATQAHLTLPLYYKILRDTEVMRGGFNDQIDGQKSRKAFRIFTLLPYKSGFTISHIPLSSMALMHMLRDLQMEKLVGDGRGMNARLFWDKYFNLKCVETDRERRFDASITTDGCGVSIIMSKRSALIMHCQEPCCSEMRTILKEQNICRVVGVDPGFTDVVTVAVAGENNTMSYSSSRYYEVSKVYLSKRRTNVWNDETAESVLDIPTRCTADVSNLNLFVTRYLAILEGLQLHRFNKGYRNMRFLRSVHKKKAICDICDFIAPADKVTLVGFGDWNGGQGSPISRRTCGPLQEIKFQLKRKNNVYMKEIDEHRTSQTCNGCFQQLHNMKALSTRVDRYDGTKTVGMTRVHKVLHCKNSDGGHKNRCGTSWDRDVNASRNLLMLMMCHVHGFERPPVFTRVWRLHSTTILAGAAIQCIRQRVIPLHELLATPLPSL